MLEIRLLGQYEVRRDGEPVKITSRPSRLLLAYLVLTAGKRHPRERLAGLLWPESAETNARSNLRQALWRLRKAVGETVLLVDNETVAFDPNAGCWVDTSLLDQNAGHAATEAVAVYEGELLPGYYEEWVLLERERLRAVFERQMHCLLNTLEQQERWPEVLQWAEHWIAFGQVPEQAYRALMIAHSAQGDLAAAAAAYERCVTALQLEINVEPSVETCELYNHLLIGKELPVRALSPAGDNVKEPATRHNLPHQSTAFIGRERELAQVKKLLAGARLLTLVGPGGTGKTRLALQAASEQVGAFEQGVYFVSLAAIESADLIVQTVAETIGFPLSSHEDAQRQLLRHLRRRHYLLILDSFEHLLPGAPLVSEILQQAGQVRIMVTSREKLNLQEETIVRIEGLTYPSNLAAADALDYSAVALFVESARHLRADFTVGANDAPHIICICRLLEGMPLGVLLAAAWIEMLTAEEIAVEIARSLDFLQTEWRDVPERHQSVRAAFEPSWQRLTETQRAQFATLALFKGGFTREAAQTVAGASLRDLAGFVNKSLLRRDLESGRYEMHGLLRQFAREHLQTMSETRDAVSRAHAVYFADLMQRLWQKLISSEQQMALAMMDADLENLRQSWRYWLAQRDAARIRMYLDGFRRVYDLRGWYKTGMELFGEAVAILKPALESADEEAQTAYAELLAGQAYFMANLGYADVGLKRAQESVAILLRLQRFYEMSVPCDIMRYNANYIEDPQQGTDLNLRKQLKFTDDANGQWRWAYHITWQGREAAWRGEFEEARQQVEEGLQTFERLGDVIATVWPRFELGNIAVLQGNYSEAQKQYESILQIARAANFAWSLVKINRYLGNINTVLGEFQGARGYLLASLQLADELGMIRDIISALYDIAAVEAAAGDKETAVRLLILVREHPLSHHTRTFSFWSRDPVVRFRELADLLLTQLQSEMPPDVYAAALADGRTMELDTAVLELLADPTPSRP